MAEIRWTEEAVRWLHDIYDYISDDNPRAAQNVVDGIYEKAQILKRFPNIGYKYRDEPDGEIRILLYGHYRIAYIIKYNVVEILGVFHGALKIEKYIKQ
jgi:plasmid stabilization system protein ParE